MEEIHPARRSSGIYGIHNGGSQASFGSGEALRNHAVEPAGAPTVLPSGAVSGWEDSDRVGAAPAAAAAPKQPFYKRRWFIISQLILIPLAIILLFVLLFPVVKAIIQLVVKRTTLDVTLASISQPANNSFTLHMESNVFHTGIINANIQFKEPIKVSWIEPDGTETDLGTFELKDPLQTKSKRGFLNETTDFNIIPGQEDQFARFSGALITSQNFTWRLLSHNLRVQALKFPVAHGITFDKQVTINGINSFNGAVTLEDFQLPSDDPAGGINFVAVTKLNNTSPFSLDLGTVVFDLSYKNVSLGTGTGENTKIGPGADNTVTLKGTLKPQNGADNLAVVSELFTNYLNGDPSDVVATGVSTLQSDGTAISWLSQGLTNLNLHVPFVSKTPIDPIRSINIGDLALQFDAQQPWTPAAESNTVQAALELPFGFGLNIGQIENNFMIMKDGNPVAGLSTPLGASKSSISVLSSTDTTGTINITIQDTRLSCPDPQHPAFADFNRDLTNSDVADFRLVGQSRAIANLSIGQITLDPIKVNVSTTLNGLQGLKGKTTINTVDVTGGSTDGINLGIQVSIVNPSNLKLSTGDLTLQLLRDGAILGTTLLPNLTLNMGENTINATSSFQANNSPQGKQTLDDFIGKKDVQLQISGFDGSTNIPSLAEAFQSLSLDVTLPALKTDLLDSAALQILSSTGKQSNISHVTVTLSNPFSAALQVTKVSSTVTSFGIPLGSIEQDVNFESKPHATTQSPELNLDMNFDPAALFTVTRALAVEAGLDVDPLDQIVQLGGIQYLPIPGGNAPSNRKRQANVFKGFDLPSFVQKAFKQLKSDVTLSTDVTIGDYKTTLDFSQPGVPTATDDSLDLILPVLAAPIVQKIVGGSSLGLDTVLILDPAQNAFKTQLKGSISNAGPFDAKISFPAGLTISWQGKPIGHVSMDDISVTGDVGGDIDAESTFTVADVDHLTDFTKALLTTESFDWEISGDNLTVNALGISVPGIAFTSRTVTLKGFNGLKDGVKIESFDLPANDPAGGIHLTLKTTVANPSQVGISLPSIGFNTFVGDVMIAPVSSTGTVTLAPGSSSELALAGRLVPQSSQAGLSTVSDVFNNFVAGKDSNVVVHGASAGSSDVTWLNQGIQALQVATILPNQGPQNLIKSITLNELSLTFSQQAPFAPVTGSKSTDAAFTLPFGFPLDISALEQTITLGFKGNDFAQLAIPRSPASTDVQARIIHLGFSDIPFAVFDNGHSVFEDFVAATTVGTEQTLRLSGSASADAKTAVGTLSLTGINFSVDSTIAGLQGLNARPVTIADLDVNHGFPDFLLIKVNSALFNPSNLTIGTGDVSFGLQFEDQTIGSAQISNLVIKPGNASYPIDVHYAPQGGAADAGRTLLQNFLQGVDAETTIQGSTGSTPIESLQSALSQIRLSPVTLPGLHQTLIKSASLVFPTDIVKTGVASSSFTLANPFTASINLLKLAATAKFHNLTLGTIPTTDASAHPIHADGHGQVTSPSLPLNFNLDPATIIQLLTITAQQNGVDLGPLPALFQFILSNPDFKPPVNTTVDTQGSTCSSGHQFDVNGAILKALSGLKVDLAVESSVKLDDFPTDLSFDQNGVPAVVDKTVLFLIGAVAAPVAQHLVDGSVLAFTEADISNITNGGFDIALKGSLTNIGPLDALITFTEPLNVNFQGKDIAQITLPPICAAANDGVPDYQAKGHVTITDQDAFTDFAVFLLHQPSFEWTISTPKLRVSALGTIFDNVSLSKVVTFKAFNNLPGVAISNFQLPSDDEAGGIHIETDATIPSPAQIGIDLGTVSFNTFFEGTQVGPLSATNLVLKSNSVTKTHLSGRIVPQSGDDLDTIGKLFSQFLSGGNSTLQTVGNSVQPGGSGETVNWLTTAFKTLSLDVTLPGQKFQVIQEIDLNDLQVTLQTPDQDFNPPTSSANTLAKYKNPFGFSLQVVEAAQSIILSAQGAKAAQLDIPRTAAIGGVSTGNVADLQVSWSNVPLKSLDNGAFATLFAGVTLMDDVSVGLSGSADVVAKTSIGNVPIAGIPIDVTSGLKGINSFGGKAGLSDVTVTGSGGDGGDQFIITPLKTTLNNPSNITLNTVNIALPVIFNGVTLGRAVIDEFDLKPGENVVDTEFHYQPADANDTVAQSFLSDFIQSGDPIDLTIHGDRASSPFGSLQAGLANLQLSTSLNGINHPNLITQILVTITLDSLVTNLVSAEFFLTNPLDATLVIENVQSDGSVDGTVFAQFNQPFSNFVIPPGQTVSSGQFDNVLLPQGAIASLDIVPLGVLDIAAGATVRVGEGGYQIPFLQLHQTNVPTTYNLALT
ncbi:hypothetical protein CPC08DRAFT_706528 [Agrocybe pediades]|nr:hypothetical protein CPC08DRAFT_706528 [Agrocybe pediades]